MQYQTFKDFLAEHSGRIDLSAVVLNLVITGFLAFLLGRLYIYFGRSPSNRRAFAEQLVFISITTATIIVVVKSSLALSLGLVGALSIVRFRSAVREHEELSFLFVAIALGLCLGADQRALALVVFVLIGSIMVSRHYFSPQHQFDGLFMRVEVPRDAGGGAKPADEIIQKIAGIMTDCCSTVKLKRCDILDGAIESSFQLTFESLDDLTRTQKRLADEVAPSLVSVIDSEGIV